MWRRHRRDAAQRNAFLPPLTEAGVSCELLDESGNFAPCPYTRDNLEAVEAKLILEIPDA